MTEREPIVVETPPVDYIRFDILLEYQKDGSLDLLWRRANFNEIGLTGNVSLPERRIATEENLKPLNSFEKWLLNPFIIFEKKRRWDIFRQVCLDTLGEDIDEVH